MSNRHSAKYIYDNLELLFPEAECELVHRNSFELLIAVVLSAQTTDASVNKVTKTLFERFPDAYSLAKADVKEVEDIIHSIGLYRNKAKNIVAIADKLCADFNGIVPANKEQLVTLPGVGIKSANVVASVCFGLPAIAVDTHVNRVAKRLRIASESDSVLKVEEKLMAYFPKNKWSRLHHLMIFFGRYKCHSQNPDCTDCPFIHRCTK